jgi:hypothetical protein
VVAAFDNESLLVGSHVPPTLTDNDCGMSGVVQSEQTTCHSHCTSLSMMTTILAWKQDKQVVISSVVGSC